MSKLNVASVEITLADGKVLHFKHNMGDHISVKRIATYRRKDPSDKLEEINYYSIVVSSANVKEVLDVREEG